MEDRDPHLHTEPTESTQSQDAPRSYPAPESPQNMASSPQVIAPRAGDDMTDIPGSGVTAIRRGTPPSAGRRGRKNRGQSANHLLRFTCGESPDQHSYAYSNNRRSKPAAAGAPGASGQSADLASELWAKKERFVQANFQFGVSSSVDIQGLHASPDELVDWEAIELAHVLVPCLPKDASSSERVGEACAICLDVCWAPRLTRCGHIYCLGCILTHLSYSGRSTGWHPCPLCSEPVYAKHLKLVQFHQAQTLTESTTVARMQLMARPRDSLCPSRFSLHRLRVYGALDPPCPSFTRFSVVTDEQLLKQVQEDIGHLRAWSADNHDRAHVVEASLQRLEEQRQSLETRMESHIEPTSSAGPMMFSMDDDMEVGRESGDQAPVVDNGDADKLLTDLKFFSQLHDGQKVFLDPFNAKCLQKEFGSLSECPNVLDGLVVSLEGHVMTESNRRKMRHLAHLPLGCEFYLCELDLSHLLSEKTQASYGAELERRSREREAKEALREKSAGRPMGIRDDFDSQRRTLGIPVQSPEETNVDFTSPTAGQALFPELVPQRASPVSQDRSLEPSAEVSSYARVAQQMGNFPSLGQSSNSGAVGRTGSQWMRGATSGVSPTGESAGLESVRPVAQGPARRESGTGQNQGKKKSGRGRVVIMTNSIAEHGRR